MDQNLDRLHGAINEFGVEAINMIPSYWTGVDKVLSRHFPERKELCQALARDDGYWQALENHARARANAMGVSFMGFFRHGKDNNS